MSKCVICKKKVGLLNFKCNKCHLDLCITHRDPIEHHCDFDYKKENMITLTKNNPIIIKFYYFIKNSSFMNKIKPDFFPLFAK